MVQSVNSQHRARLSFTGFAFQSVITLVARMRIDRRSGQRDPWKCRLTLAAALSRAKG